MPGELPRQALVPGMVVSGGKGKDEGGDRPLTEVSSYLYSDKIQKQWFVVLFCFSPVAADFFHCLAVFPTLRYLAAFLAGSFWFSSSFWSLEYYAFCRL